MLGKEFALHLESCGYRVTGLCRADVDITNEQRLTETIRTLQPDVIVNCAAYTAVDAAESEQESAFKVNAHALSYIGSVAKTIDAFVVHFSTDYVFSGETADGYSETETVYAACNVYGKSKREGEERLMQTGCKYAIIRVSWLFGVYGKNFVQTMLALAQSEKEIKVVNDQYGKPTCTLDVVRAVTTHFIDTEGKSGTYHLSNEGVCTWYEFATEIFNIARIEKYITPCPSTSFVRPAKRPTYSVLINTKLPQLRPWKEALREYMKIQNNSI